jgi:hypothetical protein
MMWMKRSGSAGVPQLAIVASSSPGKVCDTVKAIAKDCDPSPFWSPAAGVSMTAAGYQIPQDIRNVTKRFGGVKQGQSEAFTEETLRFGNWDFLSIHFI